MESVSSGSSPEPRIRSYTPSQSSQQSYVPSTSRPHSPKSSFSSDPYLQRPVHLIPSTPRYPESAQRTVPSNDHTDGHGYMPPAATFHLSEQGSGRRQYLTPEEGIAGPSNSYAPRASPGTMDHHLPSIPPFLSADEYRGSLRNYHSMHLSELQYRRAPLPSQRAMDDFRPQYTDGFYAQSAARHGPGPAGRLLQSPIQDAHAHYRPQDPIPRHEERYPTNAVVAHEHSPRALPTPSAHEPSSIPMCIPVDQTYYNQASQYTNDSYQLQSRNLTPHTREYNPPESAFCGAPSSTAPVSGVNFC